VAIIDVQCIKSADKGGCHINAHCYDSGKYVKDNKRRFLVDIEGLIPHAIVTPADIHDRNGGA
jgi:hypothetical protein